MPDPVDAPVNADQRAPTHPGPDLSLRDAGVEELVAPNHPVRDPSQPRESLLNRPVLLSHTDS